MKSNILTLMLFLTSTNFAYAENYMLIVGGGGEPAGKKTIFDNGMIKLGKNLKSSKWEYEVSFNGGHKKTEKILKDQFNNSLKPKTDFTAENFDKKIEEYLNKIYTNKIKTGDQLMIIINTHGFEKYAGQSTHTIALSDRAVTNLNNLTGEKEVSLDNLQEIVKLTNERGIKLGLIDLSCHSGTTLALKKDAPNTCIISSSGPNHYGFTGDKSFTENFLENLKPGINLEDAFLNARRQSLNNDYPMISTPQNDKIVSDIYKGISPYLYYYNKTSDKLTNYIMENNSQGQLCKREDDFKDLMSQIDTLNTVMFSEKNNFNVEKLKHLLLKYKKIQDDMLALAQKRDIYKLQNIETFIVPQNLGNSVIDIELKYTWGELIDYDVNKAIKEYESYQKNSTSELEKDNHRLAINTLIKVNEKKQKIFKENPNLQADMKQTIKQIEHMRNSYKLVNEISRQEKILYQELYESYQKDNKEDPCKKIIF